MTSQHTIGAASAPFGGIPCGPQNHRAWTPCELWQPPAPSTASRMPPLRTTGAFNGTIVDPIKNRILVFESMLEKAFVQILRVDLRVDEIFDQPPAVTYQDANRKVRQHGDVPRRVEIRSAGGGCSRGYATTACCSRSWLMAFPA